MKKWKFHSPASGRTLLRDFTKHFKAHSKQQSDLPISLNDFKLSSSNSSTKCKISATLPLPTTRIQDKKDSQLIVTWGSAKQGALGTGSTSDTALPLPVPLLSGFKVIQIACGAGSSYVLTSDSRVFAWGFNVAGQLGVKDFKDRPMPVPILELADKNIVKLAAGAGHCLALTKSSRLYSWGCGGHYQTGLGTLENTSIPTLLDLKGVTDMACGISHTLVLCNAGLWAVGDNQYGQCSGDKPYYANFVLINVPSCSQVAAGGAHSILLTHDGKVMCLGLNNSGQLGLGQNVKMTSQPLYVKRERSEELKGVCAVYAGEELSAAVLKNRRGVVWGLNQCGQLGQGHFSNLYYPTVLDLPNVSRFSLGVSASAVICNGELWCSGWVGEYKSHHGGFSKEFAMPHKVFGDDCECLLIEIGRTHCVGYVLQNNSEVFSTRSEASDCFECESLHFPKRNIIKTIEDEEEPQQPSISIQLPNIYHKRETPVFWVSEDEVNEEDPTPVFKKSTPWNPQILTAFNQAKEEARRKAKAFKLYDIPKTVERKQPPNPKVEERPAAVISNRLPITELRRKVSNKTAVLTSQNIEDLQKKIKKYDQILESHRVSMQKKTEPPQMKRIGGGFYKPKKI